MVEGLRQQADLVPAADVHGRGQVSLGHGPGQVHAPEEGAGDGPGQDDADEKAQERPRPDHAGRPELDGGRGLRGALQMCADPGLHEFDQAVEVLLHGPPGRDLLVDENLLHVVEHPARPAADAQHVGEGRGDFARREERLFLEGLSGRVDAARGGQFLDLLHGPVQGVVLRREAGHEFPHVRVLARVPLDPLPDGAVSGVVAAFERRFEKHEPADAVHEFVMPRDQCRQFGPQGFGLDDVHGDQGFRDVHDLAGGCRPGRQGGFQFRHGGLNFFPEVAEHLQARDDFPHFLLPGGDHLAHKAALLGGHDLAQDEVHLAADTLLFGLDLEHRPNGLHLLFGQEVHVLFQRTQGQTVLKAYGQGDQGREDKGSDEFDAQSDVLHEAAPGCVGGM